VESVAPLHVHPGGSGPAVDPEEAVLGRSVAGELDVAQRLSGMLPAVADQSGARLVAEPDLVAGDRDAASEEPIAWNRDRIRDSGAPASGSAG
jgi:hypothetical protein